ncbi:MAG: hypothetical protein O2923_02400 [Verrucomicrobia bacterium]|nr:hypothetical protein [Verrucomicrobiota bacterium]
MELLLCVAIIGLLSAVAVPHFARSFRESKIRQTEIDLQILVTAVRGQAWDTGQWPGGQQQDVAGGDPVWDLAADYAGLIHTDGRFVEWHGPYIDSIPVDPWGSLYFFDPDYRIAGVPYIVVGSLGPNGVGQLDHDSDNLYVIVN